MNSGISPTSAQGGWGLPAATPSIPGNPRVALLSSHPHACGEAAVPRPPSFRRLPLPSGALGWTGSRAGGVGRNAVWGPEAEGGGSRRRGVSSRESPEAVARSGKCGCGVGRAQAEPEKTREVGWGKGKGNWIRGAAVLEGPHF